MHTHTHIHTHTYTQNLIILDLGPGIIVFFKCLYVCPLSIYYQTILYFTETCLSSSTCAVECIAARTQHSALVQARSDQISDLFGLQIYLSMFRGSILLTILEKRCLGSLVSNILIFPSLYLGSINMIYTNHIVLLRAYHSSPLNQ